jgi:hypothetical protein
MPLKMNRRSQYLSVKIENTRRTVITRCDSMLYKRRYAVISQSQFTPAFKHCRSTYPESASNKRHDRRSKSSLLSRLDQTLVDRIPQPDLESMSTPRTSQHGHLDSSSINDRRRKTHISSTIPAVEQDLETLGRLDIPNINVLHSIPQFGRWGRGRVPVEPDPGKNASALVNDLVNPASDGCIVP